MLSRVGGPLSRRWRVASRRAPICIAAFALDLILWSGNTELRWGGDLPAWVLLGTGVLVFGAIAALPHARRFTFALALVYSAGWTVMLLNYQPFTALFLMLYYTARELPTRATLPYLAVTAVPLAMHTVSSAVQLGWDVAATAITAILWTVMTALAFMAGRFGYRAEETARLREEAVAAEAQLARQEDRLALSRELHDVLSHSMGAISLQAAGARAVAAAGDQPLDPRVAAALETIASTSTDAMRELRRLLGFLRDHAAEAADGAPSTRGRFGFTGAAELPSPCLDDIGVLVDRTRACGVTVKTRTVGSPFEMLAEQEHAAYRVVQEGLANVLRHGGRGSRAGLTLTWRSNELCIDLVSSSGAGRDSAVAEHGSGLGLRGLTARVASLGGELTAGPEGDTFALHARLPQRPF